MIRINNDTNITFGAKLVSTKKIFKLQENFDADVSFVKIDPNNSGDVDVLKNIAECWLYGKYAINIYHTVCELKEKSSKYMNNEVYALTSQKSNFENLNDNDILGLVHIAKFSEGDVLIEHIESNPEIINSLKPEYRGIGTAMLDSLKDFCFKIFCFPSKSKAVKQFYIKNGFMEYPEGSNCFVWVK